MAIPSWLSVIVLLAVAANQSPRHHFSSPQGFSFDYPAGWIVATEETRAAVMEEARPILEKLGNVDFRTVAAMVFDPCDDGFIENVNVIITPGRLPINEESRRKLSQVTAQQLRNSGIGAADERTEIVTFDERRAISTHRTVTGLVPGVTVRQWQIVLPGRNRTYTVTASATEATFPRYETHFRTILAGFRPDGGAMGLWHRLPRVAQYAIIGGIAGALWGVFRWLVPRKARAPDQEQVS
ncbi:MAG: hypothetical protein MUC88_25195 [Planctomycetes bacterium]|jgi:hypothetical protein|nr:hypothetical protein [Planctomycetota bacterium]